MTDISAFIEICVLIAGAIYFTVIALSELRGAR